MKRFAALLLVFAAAAPAQAQLETSLVAHWRLNESSGNATEASGAGYTLTNTNTVPYATGKFSNGAAFTGTDQRLSNSSVPIAAGGQTLAAWVKFNSRGLCFIAGK